MLKKIAELVHFLESHTKAKEVEVSFTTQKLGLQMACCVRGKVRVQSIGQLYSWEEIKQIVDENTLIDSFINTCKAEFRSFYEWE